MHRLVYHFSSSVFLTLKNESIHITLDAVNEIFSRINIEHRKNEKKRLRALLLNSTKFNETLLENAHVNI